MYASTTDKCVSPCKQTDSFVSPSEPDHKEFIRRDRHRGDSVAKTVRTRARRSGDATPRTPALTEPMRSRHEPGSHSPYHICAQRFHSSTSRPRTRHLRCSAGSRRRTSKQMVATSCIPIGNPTPATCRRRPARRRKKHHTPLVSSSSRSAPPRRILRRAFKCSERPAKGSNPLGNGRSVWSMPQLSLSWEASPLYCPF